MSLEDDLKLNVNFAISNYHKQKKLKDKLKVNLINNL